MNNTPGGGYSLGKSKDEFENIWDLIEAQLDKSLKSTKGDDAVQLVYVFILLYESLFYRPFDHNNTLSLWTTLHGFALPV